MDKPNAAEAEKEDCHDSRNQALSLISQNDIDGLLKLVTMHNLGVDFVDNNGMTPLQHACYKGNKEITKLLIDQGADINNGNHEHGYTALHFAALSGNPELCQILLSAGAKPQVLNSVGRSAAQMAAFVGNHSCVAVINNYLPRDDVDYFTISHGVAQKPYLSSFLAAPLHKFIIHVNVNPVRVALNLHGVLLENLDQIKIVLEMMRDREAHRGPETNEIAAFKFHYLSFVVAEVARIQQRQKKQLQLKEIEKKGLGNEVSNKDQNQGVCCESEKVVKNDDAEKEKKSDPVELFVKNMLKITRTGEYFTNESQERFIRECVRDYPYRDSNLLRQMVTSLAPKDSTSALSVVFSSINGQRGYNYETSATACSTCGEEKAPKKCSKCKAVQYCDRECQRLHWFLHKKACARLGSTNNSSGNNVNTNMDGSISQSEKLTNSHLLTMSLSATDPSISSKVLTSSSQSIKTDGTSNTGDIIKSETQEGEQEPVEKAQKDEE